MASEAPAVIKGLAGVIALETTLSAIDGAAGELIYCGYNIHDLAANTTFEEVAFLLWNGYLPNQSELDSINELFRSQREIPDAVIDSLRLLPTDANGMSALMTGVSMLKHFDPEQEDMSPEANYRKSIRLTAQMPTLLAAFDRIRKGKDVVAPSGTGSIAQDFLYMLNGEMPGSAAEKIFDTCLVLHADHGLNASTFTARVAASTLSDIYACVVAGIGALKGPLHGGANIAVMNTLLEIDSAGLNVRDWVMDKLAKKEKIMGFGHRVYTNVDPRGVVLREMLEGLATEKGDRKWLDMETEMMNTMISEKGINPNVDFFSAPVYYTLGIDTDLFTPIFAISRVTGWTAHILEQWKENRLIRPRAAYVGQRDLVVKPIQER